MATRLFNGPICMVHNWYVDIRNDGTMARTAGEVSAPLNTHSVVPTHHAHHAYNRHQSRAHRHPSEPITMVVYHPEKVLRLLNAVAVLKARRDQLVLAWETWSELKDQNKKKIPDHSGRPEFLKGTFFGATTVETGDIYEVLKTAKRLTDQSMREFLAICKKNPKDSWPYLVGKRDEGHTHLAAMAKVYSRAALLNVHSRQHADMVERIVKTTKLSCDVLVNVIGTLVGNEGKIKGRDITSSPKAGGAAFVIDIAYTLLTQETIGEHLWGVSPEMVGVEACEHYKKRGEETKEDLASSFGKEVLNKMSEIVKETMGEKAEKIMLQSLGDKGDDYAKALNTFRDLVQKDAAAVWKEFNQTGKISSRAMGRLAAEGQALAMREGTLLASNAAPALAKQATMHGKTLGRALQGARWLWVGYQTVKKCKEIMEVWEAPMEDEEQKEKTKEGEAAHE